MCGISGFITPDKSTGPEELEAISSRMTATLRHRGPDDEGVWVDASAGLALGHRRLSILDLSQEGHQPMHSANGRYVLVFNGEIYNFRVLRTELEALGHAFRGSSDTEVMLAAFSEWGLEAALKRFVGMFALALWDCKARTLHLAKDRMGEKPLYYGLSGGVLLFGSELKALRSHPDWQAEIDRGALALFLRHQCVPTPHCIYEGIFKLIPGCFLSLTEAQIAGGRIPKPQPYWSLRSVTEAGISQPFAGTEPEAVDALESLLRQSISQQLIADVPVGAFLSGGVDSATVVALMQAQSRLPVRTFSIGFTEERYNEARYAKAVAQHLGTQHTEFYVQPEELQEIIRQLPVIYDEPFSDSSQIPTVLLCRLSRQQVTVSLSGDAGDELFGGYHRYFQTERLWNSLRLFPLPMRERAAPVLRRTAQSGLNAGFKPGRTTRTLNRLSNFAEVLPVPNELSLYRLMMSSIPEPQTWLKAATEPPSYFSDVLNWQFLPELPQRMMYLDSLAYLPDDILVKVDRAAMSVGLETRIPFLDHRVVEFAWTLPRSLKFKNGQGKYLLRQVLQRNVPRELVDRPKKGFGVPLSDWLRGPLRDWAESLLSPTRLHEQGFFREEAIRLAWREHLTQKRDWCGLLWNVLMFQAWLESQDASASDGGRQTSTLSLVDRAP